MINSIFLLILIFFSFVSNSRENKLISYQSEYEISLSESDNVRLPGKTYVDKASGQLFIDWINNCDDSWVSNQRMVTRFINSHGVGTLSEINYSLNEIADGSKMEYVLEVKENAELVNRTIGKAEKGKNLEVSFPSSDKDSLKLDADVIFPHNFLEEIVRNMFGSKKMLSKKVYEGTIPDKFFNISVFFTDKILTESSEILSKDITNNFKKIKMSYYQDNSQTPIFEQTVHLNEQGVASFFKYDYQDYSLDLKLKSISTVKLKCD